MKPSLNNNNDSSGELATRVLSCPQCSKVVTWTSKEDIICFCNDICLNSYVIESTTESKEELLEAITYADNRNLDSLEEEF